MFSFGPHYRAAIFSMMDRKLNYDFYFGDFYPGSVKLIDTSGYLNYQKDLKNIFFFNIYWQRGVVSNIFKPYDNFIMTGELSGATTWIAMIFAKILGKKVYLWSHGWYERDGKVKSFFRKLFFSLSHKVLLYGDGAKKIMMNHGFSEEKLIGIYNSLDYDTQKEIRDKLTYTNVFKKKFANNYPTLSFVGRIQEWKRLDLLIDAMVQLKTEGLPLNLVIIGEDSENTGLYEYVVKNNLLKNVWFYGACYDEQEIGTLLFNSNICVSPGNVGLLSIHSLMYGTPVITHSNLGYQNPEVEAITEGVTGSFFKMNDSRDLAIKIREWIQNHPINDLTLREKCYKIVDERYNPYYQIEVLRNLIGID